MDEPIHPIMAGLSAPCYIRRIEWHMKGTGENENYVVLDCENRNQFRRMKFTRPIQVQVDCGYDGQQAGFVVYDIRSRQWDDVRVEVRNLEQDPGITFYAADVLDVTNANTL